MVLMLGGMIELLTFYFVLRNLCQIKFRKLETFITLLAGTIAFYALVFFILPALDSLDLTGLMGNVVFIIIGMAAIGRHSKIYPLNALYTIIAVIVYILSGYLIGVLLDFIIGLEMASRESITNDILLTVLFTSLSFALSYSLSRVIGKYLQKRISPFDDGLKKSLAIYLLCGAVFILLLFFVNVFLHDIIAGTIWLNLIYGASLAACFVVLVFAIFSFTDSHKKDTEISYKNEMLANLQAYTSSVEEMATEARKFRHDHANLLIAFNEYLNDENVEGALDYYNQYLSTFAESTKLLESHLDNLKNIKDPEIKSILSAKLLYAQHLGINTQIEVRDEIKNVGIDNLIALCRITGILLDNAIEACKDADGTTVKFTAFAKGEEVVLVFANNFVLQPSLSKINMKGYTTKGNERGMGLYAVSQLLVRNTRISMQTSINGRDFVQRVTVLPTQDN